MKCTVFKIMRIAVVGFFLLACNSTPTSQTISLPNSDIAYLSDRSGVTELWLFNMQTHTSQQLTRSSCADSSQSHGSFRPGVQFYAWSTDGDKIAYAIACSFYDRAKMFIFNLVTGNTVSIGTADQISSEPSWSPDGNRLIFGQGVFGFSAESEYGIYLFDLNKIGDSQSGNPERIMSGANCDEGCLYPAWSPNGKYIAYQGPRVPTAISDRDYVSIIAADEYISSNQPITDSIYQVGIHDIASGGLAWSPNSQLLAIATVHEYTGAYLEVRNINDPHKSILSLEESNNDYPSQFGAGFYTPLFAPDGSTLYFVAAPLTPTTDDYDLPDRFGRFGVIYRIPISPNDEKMAKDSVQAVSPDRLLAGFPSLSYDGRWLTYTIVTTQSADIWLGLSNGQFRYYLIRDGYTNTQPAWRPKQN